MSDRPIIEVENLGKRYRLGAGQKNERYTALRDVLAEKARSLLPRRRKQDTASADPQEFWALKDVSFTVKPGEVVGIIGRNGAGKSTLLKILSRITDPTEGRVTLRGRVASLLEVGTGFHPELTGRENIYLNGAVLGMQRAEIRRKFDEIVAFAEVDRFLDTPVKRYSSGMYVRLAFAVAAHLEPEILIVDEVLAVGDAEFQKKCLGKMSDVASGGRTVLFVSHNMAAVSRLCRRGMVLDKGLLVENDGMEVAIAKYNAAASQNGGFTESDKENRFRAVSLIDENGRRVTSALDAGRYFVYFELLIQKGDGVNLGFTLYNQFELPLLSCSLLDSVGKLSEGEVAYTVEVPVFLLKPGNYRVEGALWSPYKLYEQHESLTSFEVQTRSYLAASSEGAKGLLTYRGNWKEGLPADGLDAPFSSFGT